MDKIEIEVPVSFVERGIESMRDEVERMEGALEYMEENNLQDTEGHWQLRAERDDLEAGVEYMEELIEDEREQKNLETLFE